MNTTSDPQTSTVTKKCLSPTQVKNIQKQFEEKEYYEAYSFVSTFARRCVKQHLYDDAASLYHEFGQKFLQQNRFDIAAELGYLLVDMFLEASLAVTQERVNQILDIFSLAPETPEPARHRFIEHALKWAIKESGSDSYFVQQLHYVTGLNYKKEKLYGLAQGHLVFCHDGELLGELLAEWLPHGYPSERPLFILRAILMLLAKNDIQTAEDTLNSQALYINLEDTNLSPALQLAYLMIEACKTRNDQLFDLLTSKYSLVIRRDKLFSELLDVINTRILERQPTNKHVGFLNMLSSLFGNTTSPASPTVVGTLS